MFHINILQSPVIVYNCESKGVRDMENNARYLFWFTLHLRTMSSPFNLKHVSTMQLTITIVQALFTQAQTQLQPITTPSSIPNPV